MKRELIDYGGWMLVALMGLMVFMILVLFWATHDTMERCLAAGMQYIGGSCVR